MGISVMNRRSSPRVAITAASPGAEAGEQGECELGVDELHPDPLALQSGGRRGLAVGIEPVRSREPQADDQLEREPRRHEARRVESNGRPEQAVKAGEGQARELAEREASDRRAQLGRGHMLTPATGVLFRHKSCRQGGYWGYLNRV